MLTYSKKKKKKSNNLKPKSVRIFLQTLQWAVS